MVDGLCREQNLMCNQNDRLTQSGKKDNYGGQKALPLKLTEIHQVAHDPCLCKRWKCLWRQGQCHAKCIYQSKMVWSSAWGMYDVTKGINAYVAYCLLFFIAWQNNVQMKRGIGRSVNELHMFCLMQCFCFGLPYCFLSVIWLILHTHFYAMYAFRYRRRRRCTLVFKFNVLCFQWSDESRYTKNDGQETNNLSLDAEIPSVSILVWHWLSAYGTALQIVEYFLTFFFFSLETYNIGYF